MDIQLRAMRFALKLGIVLFPLASVLDFFIYPGNHAVLMIRFGITGVLVFILLTLPMVSKKYLMLVSVLAFFLASLSISLMTVVTGDGFASPFFAAQLLVFVVASVFFNISPLVYAVTLFSCVIQHFIVLSFIPWEPKDLVVNIYFLGAFVAVGFLIHEFIRKLNKELVELKKILPICSKCKKIRDEQGSWHHVDIYIRDHSDTEFSHGLCPGCLKEYKKEMNLK